MRLFNFQAEVWLPRARTDVFTFFADAANLETITPSWLRFEILTTQPVRMQPGTLIDYRIRVRGIPFRWQTEIEEWKPPLRFVDVQRRGPYEHWHHTHCFEDREGGTLCCDYVRYRPRGGALMNWLFVRRDMERIFQYRSQRLRALFPAVTNEAR